MILGRITGLSLIPSYILVLLLASNISAVQLPFDNTCPIHYDNDEVSDTFTDFYVMTLASAGKIRLSGMSTSMPVDLGFATSEDYERMARDRNTVVALARKSGFLGIPDPVRGVKGRIYKPAPGRIEDTKPNGSAGGWAIVKEARKATPEKPLVVVVGGPVSVVADAYLLDNSIADKVVVLWFGGYAPETNSMGEYQAWLDPWASYIVVMKLRLVAIPGGLGGVAVPRSKILSDLPDTPLRQCMYDLNHPQFKHVDYDGDAPAAIPLIHPDYIQKTKRVSFSHWLSYQEKDVPAYKDDPKGNVLVAINGSGDKFATEKWWQDMADPAAWNPSPANIPKQ
jgi:hypothetical protein